MSDLVESTSLPVEITSFAGWADANNISTSAILAYLCSTQTAALANSMDSDEDAPMDPSTLGDAFEVIKKAFQTQYPSATDIIESAFEEVEFATESPRDDLKPPFFIDRGDLAPLVCVAFDGTARSLVDLAHEMAHCLHHFATNDRNVPPVYRELCAFLGEQALLDCLKSTNDSRAKAVSAVVAEDNGVYLKSDFGVLFQATQTQGTEYNYRWNYPIARHLAFWLKKWLEPENTFALFEAGNDIQDLLNVNEILRTSSSRNYLPQVGKYPNGSPQNAYAQLGMMSMLDIDYWEGNSEKSIEMFYADLLKHLQDQSVFLMLDIARRPIGYAAWYSDEHKQVQLTRQSAPFGDHLRLHKHLQKHLKEESVASNHERSSRREQMAW